MSACVLPAAGVFGAGAEWDHGILSVHRLVLTVRLCIHTRADPQPQKSLLVVNTCENVDLISHGVASICTIGLLICF